MNRETWEKYHMESKMINHKPTWLKGYTRNRDAIETIWKRCGREAFVFAIFAPDDFPGVSVQSLTRKLRSEGHIVKKGWMQSSDKRIVWALSSNAIQYCINKFGLDGIVDLEEHARAIMGRARAMSVRNTKKSAKKSAKKKKDEFVKTMVSQFIIPIYTEAGVNPWTFSRMAHILGHSGRVRSLALLNLIEDTGCVKYITRKNGARMWKISDTILETLV